jgi:hypothetical protein
MLGRSRKYRRITIAMPAAGRVGTNLEHDELRQAAAEIG